MIFDIGQKVRCVNNSGHAEELVVGKEYTVRKPGEVYVILEETDGVKDWFTWRFEAVEAVEVVEAVEEKEPSPLAVRSAEEIRELHKTIDVDRFMELHMSLLAHVKLDEAMPMSLYGEYATVTQKVLRFS